MAVEENGSTPLAYAASGNENPEIIQILIDHEASITAEDQDGKTPTHMKRPA
jgi:ankyrin repeat protein